MAVEQERKVGLLIRAIVAVLDVVIKLCAAGERWAEKYGTETAMIPPDPPKAKDNGRPTNMWDLNHQAAQREFDTFGRASWPSGAPLSERDRAVYHIR